VTEDDIYVIQGDMFVRQGDIFLTQGDIFVALPGGRACGPPVLSIELGDIFIL
jgi:hypothetical protein